MPNEVVVGGLTEQFLLGHKFIRCERGRYYRTKLYDDTYLEVDTEDQFASITKIEKLPTWKNEKITRIVLPSRLTKESLLKLLESLR